MLDKLFSALSRFAYGELTRHIRDEKLAAAAAAARRQDPQERQRNAVAGARSR